MKKGICIRLIRLGCWCINFITNLNKQEVLKLIPYNFEKKKTIRATVLKVPFTGDYKIILKDKTIHLSYISWYIANYLRRKNYCGIIKKYEHEMDNENLK